MVGQFIGTFNVTNYDLTVTYVGSSLLGSSFVKCPGQVQICILFEWTCSIRTNHQSPSLTSVGSRMLGMGTSGTGSSGSRSRSRVVHMSSSSNVATCSFLPAHTARNFYKQNRQTGNKVVFYFNSYLLWTHVNVLAGNSVWVQVWGRGARGWKWNIS